MSTAPKANVTGPFYFLGILFLLLPTSVFAEADPKILMRLRNADLIGTLAVTPDGRYVISNGTTLWDLSTGRLVRRSTSCSRYTPTISPDGRHLVATCGYDEIRIVDVSTGKVVRTFPAEVGATSSVAVSPDNRFLISGGRLLRLWDLTNGTLKLTIPIGENKSVHAVAFSPNGHYVVTGNHDKTVRLWDPTTGDLVRKLTNHTRKVVTIAFSPDGQYLGSGSYDQTLRIWEVATGKLVHTFTGHTGPVWTVAFSPDSQYIASGSYDRTLRLWDRLTGKLVRTFTGFRDGVGEVTFSSDGRHLISGNGDGTIKVWVPHTGKWLLTLVGFKDGEWVGYTPSGYYVASPNAGQYITFLVGYTIYGSTDYESQYHNPEMVEKILRADMR